MSQNTTKYLLGVIYLSWQNVLTHFGPSSGHKYIYLKKLYSMSHKIYQTKIQGDLIVI